MGPIRLKAVFPSLLWFGNENVLGIIGTPLNFDLETKEGRIEKN